MSVYREAKCPERGPGLTHMQSYEKRPDGSCLFCNAMLTQADPASSAELERLFTRTAIVPDYNSAIRSHSAAAIVAYRSHRPLMSAKEGWAAQRLARATLAECDDPEPTIS